MKNSQIKVTYIKRSRRGSKIEFVETINLVGSVAETVKSYRSETNQPWIFKELV